MAFDWWRLRTDTANGVLSGGKLTLCRGSVFLVPLLELRHHHLIKKRRDHRYRRHSNITIRHLGHVRISLSAGRKAAVRCDDVHDVLNYSSTGYSSTNLLKVSYRDLFSAFSHYPIVRKMIKRLQQHFRPYNRQ